MSAHMLLAIREIFAGAKFHGIACQPLRRNFRGFDFCTHCRHCARYCVYRSNFCSSYFGGGQPIRKKREILHHAKVSCYAVPHGNTIIILGVSRSLSCRITLWFAYTCTWAILSCILYNRIEIRERSYGEWKRIIEAKNSWTSRNFEVTFCALDIINARNIGCNLMRQASGTSKSRNQSWWAQTNYCSKRGIK